FDCTSVFQPEHYLDSRAIIKSSYMLDRADSRWLASPRGHDLQPVVASHRVSFEAPGRQEIPGSGTSERKGEVRADVIRQCGHYDPPDCGAIDGMGTLRGRARQAEGRGLSPMRYQYNTPDSAGARGVKGAVSVAAIRKLAV
ncbi:MAG TPA: hypothetical protein PLG27_07240, partial [Candidatus Latescibacteria bacterium]|nr:hypothetical protein [Candidatus Latescibacterota bacterium]